MQSLSVLYDPDCGLCRNCKLWVMKQPTYFPIRFFALGSEEAARRYPQLVAGEDRPRKLLAVTDRGDVYRDDKAWLIVLYGLRQHRSLAMQLARPALRGLASRAYAFIARNRDKVSARLGLLSERDLYNFLHDAPDPTACDLPRPSPAAAHQGLEALRSARQTVIDTDPSATPDRGE